jgi:hypothetical protein
MFKLLKSKSPEEKFWNWFVKNRSKIEAFIESYKEDYRVYNQLSRKIKEYDSNLFAELTQTKDNAYVLIITPDGKREGVDATKKLGESHPEIDNWIVHKFRQPKDKFHLNFNGVEYPFSDIIIYPEVDYERDKVDIEVFIKNMNKDERKYQHLAFLYLDHILGEFNTIMKVGYIDFYHLCEGKTVKDGISLLELRKLIEEELLKKPLIK